MSALADRVALSAALPVARRTEAQIPVWFWVLSSRVLVLFASVIGAGVTQVVPGWQHFDPRRISAGMGSVGNLLGAGSVRWDAIGYLSLAQHGYSTRGSTIYFPLYPLLIRALTPPGGSFVIASVLISLVAFAIGLELVHRMTRWQLGKRNADATVLLLAFAPFSFVFSAAYSASLLFACAAGTFYLARQERFELASVVAACAALTHVEGILLVAPLSVMYWKSRGCPRSLGQLWTGRLPVLALPGISLGGFLIYLHVLGWGWFAPIANENSARMGRTLVGPPLVLLESLKDTAIELNQSLHGNALASGGVFTPGVQNIFYIGVLLIAVSALVSVWRRLPTEYALFGVLAILLCSSSAVSMEPLKGFDRYMLPVFPLWIGAAVWLEKRRLTSLAVSASAVMLVFYTVEFTRWISVF